MNALAVFVLFATALTVGPLLLILPTLRQPAEVVGRTETRRVFRVTAVAVPLLAMLIYVLAGTPQALQRSVSEIAGHEQLPVLVQQLRIHLENSPEDFQAWVLLARTLYTMEHFAAAVRVFEHVFTLDKADADMLADYADARSALAGGQSDTKAEAAVNRALQLDANHKKALWLAGTYAFNSGRFDNALDYWQRLQVQLPADSESSRQLALSMTEAQAAAETETLPAGKSAWHVSGTVELAPELQQLVTAAARLFVFVRTPDGERMPLAAVQLPAGPWPVRFRLDENAAMGNARRLADHDEVDLFARISLSGGAGPAAGDLEGGGSRIAAGNTSIRLVIDSVRP